MRHQSEFAKRSQLDMFEAFAAPPLAALPEPEEAPVPAFMAAKAVAAPRPLSPRAPQAIPINMVPGGAVPLGPAPRAPAEGIIIAPRDREFVARPFDELEVGHHLLAGTADQRAAVLCRVTRVGEEYLDTVVLGTPQDNRMRFCRESGALIDASLNRRACDNETVLNSGIKIRATGSFVDRNAVRDVPHGALMRAFQSQIPPLPKGYEAEFLTPYEPLPPPAMRG